MSETVSIQLLDYLMVIFIYIYINYYHWFVLQEWISQCNIAAKVKPELRIEMRTSFGAKHINFFLSRNIITRLGVLIFSATFNNILAISWWSVLLVEEIVVPKEIHRTVTSYWQTLSHNIDRVYLAWVGFELTTSVVIGIDCIGSC